MSIAEENRTKPERPSFDFNLENPTPKKNGGGNGSGPRPPRRSRWQLSAYLRIRLVLVLLVLIAAGLVLRLFVLQAQDGAGLNLSEHATAQNLQTTDIPAPRGQIRTADGLLMASDVPSYNVYAYPDGFTKKQTDDAVNLLMQLLPNADASKIRDAMTYTDKDHLKWTLLASNISNDVLNKLQTDLNNNTLTGVFVVTVAKRVYPNGSLLGHILGFAHSGAKDSDGLQGAYGVEGFYNDQLKGKPGQLVAERDVNGDPIAIDSEQLKDPVSGDDLTLTIDTGAQYIVERELAAGMKQYKATQGMIIVMNPNTGGIIAEDSMQAGQQPFDPNNFATTDYSQMIDPVVSTVFEPGSTFKIFTSAIGIDIGAVEPDTNLGNLPGCEIRYTADICNWNSEGHANQTVVDTLRWSSNVGADHIADHIAAKSGVDTFYTYLKNFGFGQPTGVDLEGESQGIMPTPGSKSWIALTYDQNAFGQGIAVTPIQLVSAIAAVANGGKLMTPHVVQQVSHDGKVIQQNDAQVVRQVISPQTSQKMNQALTDAMSGDDSETALACVPGYKVAAKTGTAQIPAKGGGYEDGGAGHTIGSTVGYGPSDNPQLLVYVRFDRANIEWGSNTAGPVVHNVLSDLFQYFKIPPSGPNICKYYK